MTKVRDNNITILKALAITFVVMAHAASPLPVSRLSYMIGVSLFFMASGCFFNVKYLNDEGTFVKRRLHRLYVPFVKWSVLLLILHNLWFHIGILSETYGNATGEVTHPLNAQQWMQSLWSIVTNMSGYDAFLGEAYWFFRALLVSGIAFLILFKLLSLLPFYRTAEADAPEIKENPERFSPYSLIALTISGISLGLAMWKTGCNLQWTGLSQGGYRELMGIFFLSTGYLYHRFFNWVAYNHPQNALPLPRLVANSDGSPLSMGVKCRHYAAVAWISTKNFTRTTHRIPVAPLLFSALIVALLAAFPHPTMAVRARNIGEVLALALSGIAGFALIYHLSVIINNLMKTLDKSAGNAGNTHIVSKMLLYIGDNTLYIFGWHLLAFKLASMLKVGIYGLPWEMVGGHPVVHSESGQWFWVIYTIIGIAVPLLCVYLAGVCRQKYFASLSYSVVFAHIGAALSTAAHYASIGIGVATAYTWLGMKWLGRMIAIVSRYVWKGLSLAFGWIFRGLIGFWHSLIKAVQSGADIENED